jgi:hypothetical protein
MKKIIKSIVDSEEFETIRNIGGIVLVVAAFYAAGWAIQWLDKIFR